MILHRPGPVEREAEIKVWGDWVWCFWHRVGEKVIVCQWARRKYTRISNNKFRVEWRNPDKTLIESLIFDEPAFGPIHFPAELLARDRAVKDESGGL